ncbi:MAG: hypothetical protein H6Q70_1917 [Firmicutes bacterium]|nr:hypothetical protein [Bacillota bacterium]
MNLMNSIICKILWVMMIFSCFGGSAHATQALLGQGNVALYEGAGVFDEKLKNIGHGTYELNFSTANDKNIDSSDVYFSVQGLTNWSGYHMVAVHVENVSDVTARIGIEVKLSPLVVLTATEGQPCFWQADGDTVKTIVLPTQGMIELSPQDSGTLFIPFTSLSYKERKFPITYFTAWNFRVNAPKNSNMDIRFGEFTLYQPGEIDLPDSTDAIEGDTVIQIPLEGAESIALYHLGDKQASFHLAKKYSGISLTPQGRLSVSVDVQPQIIKLFADVEGENERLIKNVTLKLSDKVNVKDTDGDEPLLLPTDKLYPIYDPTSFLTQDRTYIILRWVIFGIFLGCMAAFLYGNYLHQKDQKNRRYE